MNSLSFAAPSVGSFPHIASTLAVVCLELALLAAVMTALYRIATRLIRRVAALGGGGDGGARVLRSRTRNVFVAATLVIALAIVGYNARLVFRGIDVKDHTLALLGGIGATFWIELTMALLKVAAVSIGIVLVPCIVRIALSTMEAALNQWD